MKLPLTLLPREAKAFDVVGFGENSLDLMAVLPGPPGPDAKMQLQAFEQLPGGVVATAMVACARLGWRTRYAGSLGSDAYAGMVEAALRNEGLDLSAVRRVAGPNRMAIVLVDAGTGRRTVLERRDPRLAWTPRDVVPGVMSSGRVLLVDSRDPEASTVAARSARAGGTTTVVDVEQPGPGIDRLLSEIDILITAESFPEAYTGCASVGEALARLETEFRPAVAVVTLGAEGSLAVCGGREIRTPACAVSVVDTTGAGDAFRGGFIAGWLQFGGDRLETLLEYANQVAAFNCRAFGAQTGLPTAADMDLFVTGADRVRSN